MVLPRQTYRMRQRQLSLMLSRRMAGLLPHILNLHHRIVCLAHSFETGQVVGSRRRHLGHKPVATVNRGRNNIGIRASTVPIEAVESGHAELTDFSELRLRVLWEHERRRHRI